MSEDDGKKKRRPTGSSVGLGYYIPPERDLALADVIASLPEAEQKEMLAGTDPESLLYDFDFWGRPSQLFAMKSDAWLTVCLAGRGYGKTRVLSQWVHKKAMEHPGCRIALVGRVTSDVRDVILMGDSGIMNVTPPSERPRYVATMRRVIWPNGSEAMTFSADIANQLRGPQFHFAAADELGSWRVKADSSGLNAWDNLKIATRLGDHPQIMVATTPRRVPSMLEIMAQAEETPDKVMLVRGSTFSNRHLSDSYRDVVTGLYAGTHLGAQELEGELIGDISGALLKMETIDEARDMTRDWAFAMSLPFRAVGVDPSVSERPNDECGIVVVGSTGEREMHKRHAYIFEDSSIMGSPEVWAKEAVRMAEKYNAVIVVEDNQGGEMVRMIMKNVNSKIPVVKVKAYHGKAMRAEPVVLAYEQGRIHHTDYFGELESQLTTWVPGETLKSPDRLDAAVHGIAALVVKQPRGWSQEIRISNLAARSSLPGVGTVTPITAAGARRMPGGRERLREARMLGVRGGTPGLALPPTRRRFRAG